MTMAQVYTIEPRRLFRVITREDASPDAVDNAAPWSDAASE